VQYSSEDLAHRMRNMIEAAVRSGSISFEEAGLFLHKYEQGLAGYTYLERD
jgi:arginine decarboxylase